MKKLEKNKMEKIQGGKGSGFVSGLLCGYGLLTAETGVGLVLAVVGCSGWDPF